MDIIFIALEQSLLLLPLVLGIYLTYSILKVTDLTVDGTFVLGAAVFARLITNSYPVEISMAAAILAGAAFGMLVSLIQYKNRVKPLIAGILMVLMLQTINLQVLGRPNVSIYGYDSFVKRLSFLKDNANLTVSFVSALLILGLLSLVLKSNLGLILRGMGDNKTLVKKLGKKIECYKIFALALSNALAATCGAISAQIYGYTDISMGYGVALTAIGAVIIGSQLVKFFNKKTFKPTFELFGALGGTYIYFLIINIFLALGLDPINLKLVLGLILVVFLTFFGDKNHE